MPMANLVGLGSRIGGLAGEDHMQAFFAEWFGGAYQNTLGTEGHHVYGTRSSHIFGTDNRLVVGGGGAGLFPFLGTFINEFSLFPLGILGLGDDVVLTYGQKIDIVYGGPSAKIQRGPSITRKNYRPLGRKLPMANLINVLPLNVWSKLHGVFGGETSAMLAANQPGLPPTPDQGNANPAAYSSATDDAYESTIVLLSQLSILTAAAVDLTVRIKYPQYGADFQKPNKEQDPVPGILVTAGDVVVNLFQAIIYHLEISSIYQSDLRAAMSEAMDSLKKAGSLVVTSAVKGAKAIGRFLLRALNFLWVVIKNILLLLITILIIALALGVAAAVVGGIVYAGYVFGSGASKSPAPW